MGKRWGFRRTPHGMRAWRGRAPRCEAETTPVLREPARVNPARANPAKIPRMARRKASAPKAQRRPRAEIDRNYFLGDVLIKTGVAVAVAIALVIAYAPAYLRGALEAHQYAYPGVLAAFLAAGLGSFLAGRHLRREATQWDYD